MYEEFFGLTDAPFRLTPDPHFLYLSPKHAEALAHLRLGLREPGGFVCITGDIGTGKTTVLRTFLAELGPEIAIAYVFNPTLSWEDLLQRIARELGVSASGGSHVDAMDALNTHLLAERKAGRIAVVVIDEAQALPLDVLERLRLLSNLETSTEKLLRLVLVGQPQLARLLLDPALAQLNQRITLRWHLAPLTRTETFAYVRHRLAVAGGSAATTLFTRPALRLVHRFSRGVPRLVNMIAHRAALAAYVARQRRVTASSVRRAAREIRSVPLVVSSRAKRVAWVASAVAAGVGLATLGLPRFEPRLAAAPAAPPPPIASPVAAPPAVAAVVVPARDPAATIDRHLQAVVPEESFRGALATALTAWAVDSLRSDEGASSDDLEAVAHRRGLEALRLTGNLSMLRLLDLPAVLELRRDEDGRTTYVALVGIDDGALTLDAGGEAVRVAPDALDRVWYGDAFVLWRDFESLGPTFGAGAQGPHVARLQRLLARVGSYAGMPTGSFDQPTQAAVVDFQRSRRLDPDCRVGRLTRIALYGAAGGFHQPTLAASARTASGGPS